MVALQLKVKRWNVHKFHLSSVIIYQVQTFEGFLVFEWEYRK